MGMFDFDQDSAYDADSRKGSVRKGVQRGLYANGRGVHGSGFYLGRSGEKKSRNNGKKAILTVFVAVIVFAFIFATYKINQGGSIFSANEGPSVDMEVQYTDSQFYITLSSDENVHANVVATLSGKSEMPLRNGFDNSSDWVISSSKGIEHTYISRDIYLGYSKSETICVNFTSNDDWNISFIPQEVVSSQIKVVSREQ